MAHGVIAKAAAGELSGLVTSHGLPPDTPARVRRSIQPLKRFPLMGRTLGPPWEGARFLLGPWPWMIILYEFDAATDRVVVLAFQDGRMSSAARPG
ncbi:MAG: hypothetical protein QM679_03350 [Patulibacter sp.]